MNYTKNKLERSTLRASIGSGGREGGLRTIWGDDIYKLVSNPGFCLREEEGGGCICGAKNNLMSWL
jgi:hypothetical protein